MLSLHQLSVQRKRGKWILRVCRSEPVTVSKRGKPAGRQCALPKVNRSQTYSSRGRERKGEDAMPCCCEAVGRRTRLFGRMMTCEGGSKGSQLPVVRCAFVACGHAPATAISHYLLARTARRHWKLSRRHDEARISRYLEAARIRTRRSQ